MSSSNTTSRRYTIVVEHLDPELDDWQTLEYKTIAAECLASDADFLLSGLPSAAQTQRQLGLPSSNLTEQSVESKFSTPDQRKRVCLLDPKGERDLSPQDGEDFDVFLFGGILGDDPPRGKPQTTSPPDPARKTLTTPRQIAPATYANSASPAAGSARSK